MNKPTRLNAKNIAVSTSTTYIASQSVPQEQRYVFSYTVTITNNSNETVQLLTRHWSITDANGDESTVEGDGVIGQTPTIFPKQSFTYTSGSMFKTPVGTMQGHYQMLSQKGQHLHVEIPIFRLAIPNILH